jgi:hypothetical protein
MLTDMDIHEYINKYKNGDSIASLARQYNITPYKAKKILVDNNVQLRTRAQQNVITNQKRAKSVDHNYFSNIVTLNQAWLLGFLMADGYVKADNNGIGLELSIVDKEVLEKIKQEIKSEREIKTYTTNKGFEIAKMYWSSGKQKSDLKKYGIVNRKTYKENHLPLFKNDDLTNAFILGYFDGDGYLHINNNQAVMNICAHRKELLQDIANYIQNKYGGSYSLTQDNRKLWNYNLSTTISIKYFDDIYSKAILCLDRKKKKYEKWKINRI